MYEWRFSGIPVNFFGVEDKPMSALLLPQPRLVRLLEKRALDLGVDVRWGHRLVGLAGTPDGVMCHTVSGTQWTNLWFNDELMGEGGINAALCGHWGCPVLLVTGDQAACREARELHGDGLTTVQVKEGLGRFSARHVSPIRARQMIEAGATTALANLQAVQPYVPASPVEIKVEVATPDNLERFRYTHGVEIVGGRTLISRADDWLTAWRQFYFVMW